MKHRLGIFVGLLAPAIARAHEGHGGPQGHFHAFGIEHWLGVALAAWVLAWIAGRGR